MVTLEQVEKLRKYGNISYDQAKKALEEAEGDILEAIIILEKEKIIEEPVNAGYHDTRFHEQDPDDNFQGENNQSQSKHKDNPSFSQLMGKFLRWFRMIIRKGNTNHFEVVKDAKKVITMPATILGILLLFTFWVTVPIMLVGLFLGYRYKFTGPDLGKENVNRAMDSVADAAENFKKEMKSENANGENTDN